MTDEAVNIKKEKPPTQGVGVGGIDAHGGMGDAPVIDWHRLIGIPSFEMFVQAQTGQPVGSNNSDWVANRREALGDQPLYDLYADWHKKQGLWLNETPMGELIEVK